MFHLERSMLSVVRLKSIGYVIITFCNLIGCAKILAQRIQKLVSLCVYGNIISLLHGRHQRHRPTHKSRNLVSAVCIILIVQYQQKPSAGTIESQRTARCRPRSNNKPFYVGEFVLYVIYGTWVVVLCHKSRNSLLTNIK